MIPIAKPLIGKEEKAAVLEVLESGMLAQGKKVTEFEDNFAKYIGVKHAIATSNGTTALHTALLAHGIGPGDEVITTPFTFIATANAIKMVGATPVFVDIEEHSFNINPDLIEAAITKKTKAILPVHLFGLPANMEKIQEIARKHNLIIIEDACQAHGAEFKGQKAGSFGTGCFSFYPTKNITSGEGGMITTNDSNIADKARKIINHGSEKKYYHNCLGYNFRMTDIAAAIGIEQLKKLSQFNQKRKENAALLSKILEDKLKEKEKLKNKAGIILPQINAGHSLHQYTIRIMPELGKNREEIIEILKNKGIGSSVFYPLPVHKQKSFAEYNCLTFSVAEKAAEQVLSLPVHPSVAREEIELIGKTIKELI